jgi:hypothetical protein
MSRGEALLRNPTAGIAGCCASEQRGVTNRLRMSVAMHPTALPPMVVSLRQSHADLLLSMDAEQLIERQRCRDIQYRWILRQNTAQSGTLS